MEIIKQCTQNEFYQNDLVVAVLQKWKSFDNIQQIILYSSSSIIFVYIEGVGERAFLYVLKY